MNILISITWLSRKEHFSVITRRLNGIPVCVIGANIDSKFFPKENAVGKYIKFDKIWLRVIGVLEKNEINLTAFEQYRCKCIQR